MRSSCRASIAPSDFFSYELFNGDAREHADHASNRIFKKPVCYNACTVDVAGLFENLETSMSFIARSGAELQAAREAATAKFLAIAAALRMEAGVIGHKITHSLSGYAWPSGHINAPEGLTRKQLYILAHECGHIALNHFDKKKPRHVEEMEAEKWAHDALRRHGVSVPRSMTVRAKQYVARKIRQAKRRGAKQINAEAARYAAS